MLFKINLNSMDDITQRIRELMKYYNLNISETATKIGVSQSNLSAILSGKRPVGGNMINKFVISFDINKDWLEYGQGDMFNIEDKKIGLRMFIARKERRWTSKETAEYLNIPHLDYKEIESGRLVPNKETIEEFIEISNANPSWIYTGVGQQFTDEYYQYHKQEKDENKQKEIISRIEILLASADMSISDLAVKCKISHSELADFFNTKEYNPNSEVLDTIVNSTGANKKWLITGKGSPFVPQSYIDKKCCDTYDKVFCTPTSNNDTRPRIPYTAAAGSLTSAVEGVMAEQCEQIPRIVAFPDYDFTIIIKGNSMEPKYEGGDEVACKRVDSTSFIQWGKVHVMDTSQGIVIKRVYEDGDKIRCVSYNPEYPDFSICKDEIYSMSLVVGLLRM